MTWFFLLPSSTVEGGDGPGRTWIRRGALLIMFAWLALWPLPLASASDLESQELDLLQGRVDLATAALRSVIAADPHDAVAHLFLCRAFLSEEMPTQAAEECEKALKNGLANDSDAQDWAGRAFGRQAEHAGPLSGLHLAGEVRTAFQTAFRLNGRSPAAANDLGEFYIAAPSIVGGGGDKAAGLADQIEGVLPQTAHRLRGLLAEKRDDFATAEREFVAATKVAQAPGAYVDLATFYQRQHKPDQAAGAAKRALTLDRQMDADVVDAASTLADVGQAKQAVVALRGYLAHGLKSDAAPAFRVRTLLGQLLAQNGDKAGARGEFGQALSLASGYLPAQKGLAAL